MNCGHYNLGHQTDKTMYQTVVSGMSRLDFYLNCSEEWILDLLRVLGSTLDKPGYPRGYNDLHLGLGTDMEVEMTDEEKSVESEVTDKGMDTCDH